MVNKKFWLRMLVIVLAFGMTVVGCDDGSTNGSGDGSIDTAINGTWVGTEHLKTPGMYVPCENYPVCGGFPSCNDCIIIEGEPVEYEIVLKLYNGKLEFSEDESPSAKGTYTTNYGILTFSPTHVFISDEDWIVDVYNIEGERWYTKNELQIATGLDIFEVEQEFRMRTWFPWEVNYSIIGNTLTLIYVIGVDENDEEMTHTMIFTRQ